MNLGNEEYYHIRSIEYMDPLLSEYALATNVKYIIGDITKSMLEGTE